MEAASKLLMGQSVSESIEHTYTTTWILFHQQIQRQRDTNNDHFSSFEAMLKEYIMKNEAVVQIQTVSLKNLENQEGQLAIALSNRS